MKKIAVFLCLQFFVLTFIAAQETDYWDIDSLFDEPLPDIYNDDKDGSGAYDPAPTALGSLMRRGLAFNASYEFQGGIAPGWDTAPWFFDGNEVFSWNPGFKMSSGISLDARISETFRVFTSLSYRMPGSGGIFGGDFGSISLDNFYFDYDILKTVFFRTGKYEHSWGISPNFGFTNLLSRVPDGSGGGDAYIFRADVPIGVGGIQTLVMTRADFTNDIFPGIEKFGFGIKNNLAFRWADFDIGVFYQDNMATRGFLSVKTTVFDVELYNEWMLAVNTHTDNHASFAANLGFVKEFFDRKITLNGEFFYNGEKNSSYYKPKTNIEEAQTLSFLQDVSVAMSFLYRANGWGNPRFFIQMQYSPSQSSAQLIPGIRLTPFSNLEIYVAVPMALGSKTSHYYINNADPKNRPFSVIMLVSLSGSVQASFNY